MTEIQKNENLFNEIINEYNSLNNDKNPFFCSTTVSKITICNPKTTRVVIFF